ncbi:hypothetical protein PIB30_016419 [Stylosanthes scabra]|uniref:Uncharacterized protein n=1 Tax=Stylosanthes scabra TaxID=79078 RepID=A0ABU6V6F1_9FABA|nr:hypothetical protein [Stylosanthes scabra]
MGKGMEKQSREIWFEEYFVFLMKLQMHIGVLYLILDVIVCFFDATCNGICDSIIFLKGFHMFHCTILELRCSRASRLCICHVVQYEMSDRVPSHMLKDRLRKQESA